MYKKKTDDNKEQKKTHVSSRIYRIKKKKEKVLRIKQTDE